MLLSHLNFYITIDNNSSRPKNYSCFLVQCKTIFYAYGKIIVKLFFVIYGNIFEFPFSLLYQHRLAVIGWLLPVFT